MNVWLLVALISSQGGCFNTSNSAPTPAPAPPVIRSKENPEQTAVGSEVPASPDFQFTSVFKESQIDFQHESGDSLMKAFPAANGSGIGICDLDRDGLRDVLFLTCNLFESGSPLVSNRCYRNLGALKFVDITKLTGLGHFGQSAGVACGDLNSDGFADVYVSCYGENQLYENCGDGTFENITKRSGTGDKRWGTSAAFLDIDGDGLLDLYTGNYAQWTPEEHVFCGDQVRKVRMYCSPKSVVPEQDVLYRNAGDGTFENISERSGILANTGRTQGVVAFDVTGDGQTDLYVTNDLNPNALWVNQGGGRFEDQANLLGVAYDHTGAAQAGMGVSGADANRDGRFDLFVTNFEGEHNAYYEQDLSGFFNEVSHLRGLASASLPWIGWGTALEDFNLDGWPDVLVLNGHTDNNMQAMNREGDYAQPPLFWKNVKGQFHHIVPHESPFFQQKHPGRGMAWGDLDNDLDWDVLCSRQDSSPELLRNDSLRPSDSNVVQLDLIGSESNRDALGAVVQCQTGQILILEPVKSGGSYLCSNDTRVSLVIPERSPDSPTLIQIRWGENSTTEVAIPATSRRGMIRGANYYPLD